MIDSKQASEALAEINEMARRVRQSRIYNLASLMLIMWGALVFAGSLAKGQHSFQSTFGPITLTLPAKASFGIDAQTSFGKITNQFALSGTQTTSDARLVGTVGERADVAVKVTTSNADVVIRQGK